MLRNKFLSLGLAGSLILGSGGAVLAEGPEDSGGVVKIDERAEELKELISKLKSKSVKLTDSIERTQVALDKLIAERNRLNNVTEGDPVGNLVDDAEALEDKVEEIEDQVEDYEEKIEDIEDEIVNADEDYEDDEDDEDGKHGKGKGKEKSEKKRDGHKENKGYKEKKLNEHKKHLAKLKNELKGVQNKYDRQLLMIERSENASRSAKGSIKKLDSNIAKLSRSVEKQKIELKRNDDKILKYTNELNRLDDLVDSGEVEIDEDDLIDVVDVGDLDGNEKPVEDTDTVEVDSGEEVESDDVKGEDEITETGDSDEDSEDVEDVKEIEEISLDEIDIEEDVLARQLFMLNLYDLDK